jgi:ATP-dependent DNA helicase RecG
MSHDSFIHQLLKQRNQSNIEFRASYDVTGTAATVCAFLNADGGWIVIGHSGKEALGIIDEIAEKVDALQNCFMECISPQPLIDVRTDQFDELQMILINVIKGARQPYSFDRAYYIRKNKESVPVNPDDLSILMRASNGFDSSWEKMTALSAEIEDLNRDEIERTITEAERYGRGKALPERVDEFLNYFQLADHHQLKNGAVLLFARDPGRYLPQCRIRITAIPHGKSGSKFSDSLIIEDNLFVAFSRIQEYFIRTFPLLSEFHSDHWDRTNREKYPVDALDEAILNAMVHRDYGDFSGEITINIYPEKMEIINSGEFPPDIIKGKNQFKEHHSVLRNPTIAHMFWLRGKIEKIGRGLNLIRNRFTEQGLKTPEWTTQSGYTKLTLFSEPAKINLTGRMLHFLREKRIGDYFQREEYQEFFNGDISEKTARNDIAKMFEGNWIKRVGSGPMTGYVRTTKELPDTAG